MDNRKSPLAILQKVEDAVLVVTLAVMSLAALGQVLNRNIFMLPITWFEELSRYCMIYMTVFAAEIGLRDGTQIAVDTVVEKIHGKTKLVIQIIAKAFLVLFAVVVFVYSISLFGNQLRSGQLTPSMQIPMAIPYFALCVGFGTISATQIIILLGRVKKLFRGSDDEGKEMVS